MSYMDLGAHAYGLHGERQIRINQMLQEYNPKLSLRRIGENDPAFRAGQRFDPPRVLGVWEEPVERGESNWVFTLAEISVDDRILARIFENDFAKNGGAKGKYSKLLAMRQAEEYGRLKKDRDKIEERRDDMISMGKLARIHGPVRVNINGEDLILGDTIRPVRKFIVS